MKSEPPFETENTEKQHIEMNKNKLWNPDELATLIILSLEGCEPEKIAQLLGRTVNAVNSKYTQLGLYRVKTELVRKKIDDLRNQILALESKVNQLEKTIDMLNRRIYALWEKLEAAKSDEELVDRLNRLRLKIARLCLRYPGLAEEMGIAVDGLPMLVRKKALEGRDKDV
jgi:peptidoglycan hydrolase CwlO-like protein